MATDLYAKCPCGSGKKIKFCCRDIISDIERIERMLGGDQRSAALDKIGKLLEKHPDRPALLALQARVQIELDQSEQANSTITRLLEVEPDNPSGIALRANTLARDGDLPAALRFIHRGLGVSEGVVSPILYSSLVSVCAYMIRTGEVVAAYAHLLTAVSMSKGEDRVPVSMLMNLINSQRVPPVFQGLMIADDCPDSTWKREFEVAIKSFRVGNWIAAAEMLEDMSNRILDEPSILRNLAILQAWTVRRQEAAKSFHMLAKIRGLDNHDAIEAEACAEVLEDPPESDLYDLIQIEQDVDDVEAVMERLLSTDNVDSIPVDGQRLEDDSPPPKAHFVLLDRPKRPPAVDDAGPPLKLEDVPREYASALLFGRETDRSPRLEVMLVKTPDFEQNVDRASETVGVSLDAESGNCLSQLVFLQHILTSNLRFPQGVTRDVADDIHRQWLVTQIEEAWCGVPRASFGNLPATEAAKDPKYRNAVLGSILNLELLGDTQGLEYDFNNLRAKLGLPITEQIDPTQVDVRSLSSSRVRILDLEKVSDADLAYLFESVTVRESGTHSRKICLEVVKRPSMEEHLDFAEVYHHLSDSSNRSDEQLEYLVKARDVAVSRGKSPATYLVNELDIRITRGELEIAKKLMAEIQARYFREPGVAQQVTAVLSKYGILPTPGAPAAHDAQPVAAEATPAAAATDGGVWTPNASHTPAPASEGEKSKLWVPGMD